MWAAGVFLLCCIASASSSALHFRQDSDREWEWNSYKIAFKKKYPTPLHEAARRHYFEENLRYITGHNLEADLGKYTYRLGLNQHADLSNHEYKEIVLCGKSRIAHKTRGSTFLPPSNTKLPTTVDWRKKGYVTPVKNQGHCGSCWAFSTTGSVEGQHYKKTGKLVSLSEQNLVDCSRHFGNAGCNGGLVDQAFLYIMDNKGIDTEKSYPYEAKDRPCRFNRSSVGAKISGFVDVKTGSELALQKAVATVGPISVAIDASNMSFQFYQSGVYNEPRCSNVSMDHAVLAVGYGTDDGQDYWLVKNSWGTSWGIHGYIKMSRNRDNQCGIATQSSYPLV